MAGCAANTRPFGEIRPPPIDGFEHLAAHGHSVGFGLRSVKMEEDEFDLLDREERVFSCFQTAIDLINPKQERDPAKVETLLDFLAEEYGRTRDRLRRLVAGKARGSGREARAH